LEKKHTHILILILIVVGIIAVIIQAIIFGFSTNFGCTMRYSDYKGSVQTKSVTLNATGKYDESPCRYDNTCTDDSKRYGKWLKVDLDIYKNSEISFKIEGEVSLCQGTYKYDTNKEAAIPRVDNKHDGGLAIVLDAKKAQYFEIINVLLKDKIKIRVGKNSIRSDEPVPNLNLTAPIQKTDCLNGTNNLKTEFSPACNRYSPYADGRYVSKCDANRDLHITYKRCHDNGTGCNEKPDCLSMLMSLSIFQAAMGLPSEGWSQDNTICECTPDHSRKKCSGKAPSNAGMALDITTLSWPCGYLDSSLSYYPNNYEFGTLCTIRNLKDLPAAYATEHIYSSSQTINTITNYKECKNHTAADVKSWLAFEAPDSSGQISIKQSGLLPTVFNPQTKQWTNLKHKGTQVDEFEIIIDHSPSDGKPPKNLEDRIIFDGEIDDIPNGDLDKNFLLVVFKEAGVTSKFTGGYVLYLKQTKCYRKNGEFASAPYRDKHGSLQHMDKGKISYLLLPNILDPNKDSSLASGAKPLIFNMQESSITSDKHGILWLRIDNNQEDYKNSAGFYNLQIKQSSLDMGHNVTDIWTPINDIFISKWQSISQHIFKNMTCYGPNKTSCINFFRVIRAFLIIYIMLYGLQFALGTAQINQIDFIQRMFKVLIIAGLMNDKTFVFFNQNIFNLIANGGDQIMGAIYSKQTTQNLTLDQNLALFFKDVYEVLGSEIFWLQVVAQIGTGITGIITVLIIFLSLAMFLLPLLEFIFVYLMSSLGVAVLVSLTPIFLIFLLFESTRYLFDNWIKFLVRYIFEPIIFFIGLGLLTKLFLLFVDQVMSYSVCAKCSITFQIPFVGSFMPMLKSLESVPVFCLYWFAPWGYDAISSPFASSLHYLIALAIISFCTFKYGHLSSSICQKIFGEAGVKGSADKAAAGMEKGIGKGIEALMGSKGKK